MHFEVIWHTPWVVSLMYSSYTIIPLVVSIIEANMVGCWVWCSSHFGRSKANSRMEPRNILWKNFANIDQLVTKVGSNKAPGYTFKHEAVRSRCGDHDWWLSTMVLVIFLMLQLENGAQEHIMEELHQYRSTCYESWLEWSAWVHLRKWGRSQSSRRPWLVVEYGARHILDAQWPTGAWSGNIWKN